jgi:hypothetical protein
MPLSRPRAVIVAFLVAVVPDLPRAEAAPKVPEVVVGPAALEAARPLDAPIAEVTVFSDRARVRRRASVTLDAGVTVIRLPDLPGAALPDTIRLSASGARVLRVEAAPIERERFAIDQARKLLDELDAVGDRIVELDDRASLDEWLTSLVVRLRPAPPVPEDKREGRKALIVDVASWWKALDFLGERATAARARVAALADERRELAERADRLRADIRALNQGGFSTRLVEVNAVLEAHASGRADVELEYFVPGARWKPAYDLHFSSARGQIRVETAAVVDQTTGEDWTQAALALSTATPGRGIELPELLTWTLGERSDFVPRLRPRPLAAPEQTMAAALPAAPSAAPSPSALEADIVRARLQSAAGYELRKAMNRDEQADIPVTEPARRPMPRRYRPVTTSSSAPAGAPAAAPPAMPMEEAEEESAPMPVAQVIMRNAKRSSDSVSSVPMALFDATPAHRAPALSDPYLPAVSAGGLDHVYLSPTPATIPSTGTQVRIPLASQTFRAAVYYEATPALATTAFLRARVRNDGKLPLLRGPASIFGDGELVGVGEIQTTGPGGDIELPLGADQDIRLVRQIVPTSKTTGLIMKSEETTYDVQIQVGNYKKQPVRIDVTDQVPASRRDQVQVKLLATDPAPQAAPDADGVLRWRVELAPGATRTIRLRYQIVRPKGWVLFQR